MVLPVFTPERLTARQRLNDDERKMLAAMEGERGRPLTEQEEQSALGPGASSHARQGRDSYREGKSSSTAAPEALAGRGGPAGARLQRSWSLVCSQLPST